MRESKLLAGDSKLLAGDSKLLAGDSKLLAGDSKLPDPGTPLPLSLFFLLAASEQLACTNAGRRTDAMREEAGHGHGGTSDAP